jgi:phenylacetate-CoA ligase
MAHLLERFYPYAPVWLQNLGISLYGLAWRNERLGGDFEQYVSGFRERDRWSPQPMQAYVDEQLRTVLLHAYDQVPYYNRVWNEAGIDGSELAHMTTARLPRLPITLKQNLRAAPEEFVARDVAARHKLHRYYTSGSTGTPVTHICTSEAHRRFTAAREVRSFGWAGTSVRRSRSMIGGRLVVPKGVATPPYHRYNLAERQLYFSAFHIAPGCVQDYVRAFNRYRPRVLTGYAYSHYLLARMMCEQGLALDYEPDALVLSSEKVTQEMKQVIRSACRARVYEEYGAVENCMLATECECGSLHASPDFGIMEIVDEKGEPVPPGVAGRILCTGLLNEAQPLVRYEIGDLGVWSCESCQCGRRHLPVLQEIVGRLEDVIIGPNGRELVRFHGIFIGLPSVLEGQVIQEASDRFVVKVVATTDFGSKEKNLIQSRFAERLGPVSVQIEQVRDIPRTDRGKFRAVISRLSHQTGR